VVCVTSRGKSAGTVRYVGTGNFAGGWRVIRYYLPVLMSGMSAVAFSFLWLLSLALRCCFFFARGRGIITILFLVSVSVLIICFTGFKKRVNTIQPHFFIHCDRDPFLNKRP
jgi:hypothetical protein